MRRPALLTALALGLGFLALAAADALATNPYKRISRYEEGTATAFPDASTPDAGSFDALPANARLYVAMHGESQGAGFNNDGGASATDADGLRSTDVGVVVLTEVGAASPETAATQTERYLNEHDSLHRNVMLGNSSVTGASYVNIAQGQAPYSYSLRQVTSGASFVAANRPTETFCNVADMMYLGANDEVSPGSATTFAANMVSQQANWQADSTSQCLGHVPLFPYSHSTSTQLNPPVATSETSIGVYMASTQNPRICPWFAGYSVAPVAGDAHYTAASQRRMGCYAGHAVQKYVIDQQGCLGLRPTPTSITAVNNVVTACFVGGDGSQIALDTTLVVQKGQNYGFWYDDDRQSNVPVITGVAVNGLHCVDLTLSGNVVAPARVSYADFGSILVDPGPAVATSLGGNVRDADPALCTGDAVPLNNWLVPFRETIASVSGSASASPTFSNTQSIDSNQAASNLLSARNIPTLNGVADFTIAFWLKSNALTFPGTTNVLLTASQSQQRMLDLRLGTGGTLVASLPVSVNDTANFCTVLAGWCLGRTWCHVMWRKNGASQSIDVDGAPVTCTQTGTVPAVMRTSPSVTWAFLSSVGNSSNFNGAHLAIWDRRLSDAERDQVYNAAVPPDLRTVVSGGAPEHFWPFQGDLSDWGTGKTHNFMRYGTGLTFQTTCAPGVGVGSC